MNRYYKCCYCGKTCIGYGNNPDIWDGKKWKIDDKCCDECNRDIVIPGRIKIMSDSQK